VDSRSYTASDCATILSKIASVFGSEIKRAQPVTTLSLEQAIEAYSKIANGHSHERFSIHPNN
jgi:hypothetical protein